MTPAIAARQAMPRDKQSCRFVMTGFSQVGESRCFAFDRIEADHSRTQMTVHADLALVRLYGIRIQELPLLCCELLERRSQLEDLRDLTFGEDLMRQHKADRLIAAEQKNRVPKRAPAAHQTSPWRTRSSRP